MADYSIPTGSEILSYHGDPGLAAGAGTGLSPIQVNPLAGIDSSLDRIQDLNQKEKLLEYQQKQKDQEDLAKMLSETGGSAFNMKNAAGQNVSFQPLPEDQKTLTEKAHDLRHMILKNPDNYQFNEDYLNKRKEYDNLVSHAGLRAGAYSTYNQDAAKVNDTDERAKIMGLRKAELDGYKLGDYHMPEPYLHAVQTIDTISSKDWSDEKKLQEFGTKMHNVNGVDYETKMLGIPNAEILAPMSDVSTDGVTNINNMANGFYEDPRLRTPAYIIDMNRKIDAYSKARDIKPVYAAIIDANGNVQINKDQRQVATALNIEKHGEVRTKEKPSDAGIKQQKESTDISNLRNEIKNRDAATAQRWAKQAEDKREFDNPHDPKSKPTTESLKEERYKQAAYGAYKDVHKVFDNSFEKKPVAMQYPDYWQKNGIDPSQYNFYPAIGQKSADAFIGIQAPSETTTTPGAENAKTVDKSNTPSVIPQRVIPIEDKRTGERKLVYAGPDNKILAIVNEKDAVVNKLKHEAKYDQKTYENQTVWVDQAYGGPAAESTQPAPAEQVAAAPPSRPASIPASAVAKNHPTLGAIYVDAKNRKIYDASTGAEIKIK